MVHDIDVALTYILANKFLDENFKYAVVDQAKVAIGLQVMSGGGLIELYRSGLSERPLTKLYWEQLAYGVMSSGYQEYLSCPERVRFLKELLDDKERLNIFAMEMDETRYRMHPVTENKDADPSRRDNCLYHQHKETEKCKRPPVASPGIL